MEGLKATVKSLLFLHSEMRRSCPGERKGARKTGIGAWNAPSTELRAGDSLPETLRSQWRTFSKRITWLDTWKYFLNEEQYRGLEKDKEGGRETARMLQDFTWWGPKLRPGHRVRRKDMWKVWNGSTQNWVTGEEERTGREMLTIPV